MTTKTGLLALGVFAIGAALTISCGGSDSSDGSPTAGSSGTTAGTSSGGKGTATAGTSSSAGTNGGAGTTSNNGGTTASGGRNNGQGGFNPGVGGAGANLPDCPATAVDGEPCAPMNGANACRVDDTTYCACQGQDDPTWVCPDLGDLGAGGAGGPFGGTVTCPANAKSGDTCTGLGLCPGSQTCGCGLGTVYCQQ